MARAETEQLFLKNPSLAHQIKSQMDEPESVLVKDALIKESMIQATMAAEAAISVAAENAPFTGKCLIALAIDT